MEGFIKIYRKLLKWEWHDDPNTGWLFVVLLLLANYEDTKWRGKVVGRGQLVASLRKLSEESGVSVRSIRTGLERLKGCGVIDYKATNKYHHITILNYDSYQSREAESDKKVTNNRQTNDKRLTNTIFKKENNNNISSSSAHVRTDDIPEYMESLDGTQQMESVKRELYRLTGTVPDDEAMDSLVLRWIDELKIQGEEEKEEKDICRHFVSWARIAIPAMRGRNNNKQNKDGNGQGYTFGSLPDDFSIDI